MFKVPQGLRGRSVLELGVGSSPVVQWLGLYASTEGGTSLIPGPGTKISQAYAVWYSQKKKKIICLQGTKKTLKRVGFSECREVSGRCLSWALGLEGHSWKRDQYTQATGRRQVGLSQELPVTQPGWVLGSGWESGKEGGGLRISLSENRCTSDHGSGRGWPRGG